MKLLWLCFELLDSQEMYRNLIIELDNRMKCYINN
jgi:hypothetical protein